MRAPAPQKNLAALNGPWIVIGRAALVGALNYANSIALFRSMNLSDYGAYATFTSLFLILGLVPNALQQRATFEVARGQSRSNHGRSNHGQSNHGQSNHGRSNHGQSNRAGRNIRARPIIVSSLVYTVPCLILAPLVSSWLHLPTLFSKILTEDA